MECLIFIRVLCPLIEERTVLNGLFLQGDKVIITAHIMDIEYDEGDVLGLLEVDWRPLKSYFEFRRQVYLKKF